VKVVSNSSPLTALAAIHRFDILKQLFVSVLIPEAVHDEVFNSSKASDFLPGYIEVIPLTSATSAQFLNMNLHIGESEAIALALERRADLIILDDKLARETADRLGLKVIGTLGLLLLAKKKGLLTELRPLIQQLSDQINFRISLAVANRVLSESGEPPLLAIP
jgi:predicted nucleic acid-binding protein